MHKSYWALISVLFFVAVQTAQAKPILIQYSASVTDPSGLPRNLSNVTALFRLYRTQSGALPFWAESHTLNVKNGFLSVALGSQAPLRSDSIEASPELWLEMQLNSEIYGRQRIATTFYTVSAIRADTARLALKADTSRFSTSSGDAQRLSGKPAATFSDTGHAHARVVFADSAAKSGFAGLAQRVTAVDSGSLSSGSVTISKLADGAVTTAKLAPGAITADNLPLSKNGNFDVVGILSVDSIRFRTAKKRIISVDGGQALKVSHKIKTGIWNGLGSSLYEVALLVGGAQVANFDTTSQSYAIFVPFVPPPSSTLRKITAQVTDTQTGLPDVAVSLYSHAIDANGTHRNFYTTGSKASSSSLTPGQGLVTLNTNVNMASGTAYYIMVVFEQIDNAKTAFHGATLEFDVYEP